MMDNGLSAGDILALSREGNDGMNGMWNNPFIYLVWLAVLGGGGLFGNRNADLTRSDLFEGFNNQDVNGQLRGITNGICDGFYATQGALAENRFAAQQCCCETNRNIDAVRYDMSRGFCDVINASAQNTQRILDKMCEQEINQLRTELQSAQLALNNAAQTNTIINELRPCAKPAYITCSPYTSSGFGCGTCGF